MSVAAPSRITPAIELALAASAAELRLLGFGVDEGLVGVVAGPVVFVTRRGIVLDLVAELHASSPAFCRRGDVLEALGLTRCGELGVLVIGDGVRVERLQSMPIVKGGQT